MRRRALHLVFVVLVASAAAAAARVESAAAANPPIKVRGSSYGDSWDIVQPGGLTKRQMFNYLLKYPDEIGNAGDPEQAILDGMRDRQAAVYSRTTAAAQKTRSALARLRQSAQQMPKLRALGTIALSAQAFNVGWQIGRSLDTRWLHLSNDDWPVEDATWSVINWKFVDHPGGTAWLLEHAAPSASLSARMEIPWPATAGANGLNNLTKCTAAGNGSWSSGANCGSQWGTWQGYQNFQIVAMQDDPSLTVIDTRNLRATAYNCGAGSTVGYCYGVGYSEADMERESGAAGPPLTADPTPGVADLTTTYADGEPDETTVMNEYDAIVNEGDSTTVQYIDWIFDADNGEPDPALAVRLLAPLPGETYAEYIARLQASGWVGTATVTELSESAGVPSLGPDAPVSIKYTPYGATTPVTIVRPLTWPSPAPQLAVDTPLTFTKNPPGYPPLPTTPSGPPAVDLTPVTGIDWGCRFPFGFICYAQAVTEPFDTGADAPVFSFTLGTDAVGHAPYVVDLNVADDYMALWRDILSVCIWIGGVYWLATNLLGFRMGGDPGAAMDDVL